MNPAAKKPLLIAILLIAVLAVGYLLINDILNSLNAEKAQKELDGLVKLTLSTFPTGQPGIAEVFLRATSLKEFPRDPWGNPYDLNFGTEGNVQEFVWRSAGADEALFTPDDLLVRSPFGKAKAAEPSESHPEPKAKKSPGTKARAR